MSLQVGALCYATPVDAGRAACAQFSPVTSLSGTTLTTLSCSGVDVSGNLVLQSFTRDLISGSFSLGSTTTALGYPDCVQGDYLNAFEVFAGGFLALFVLVWSGRKLLGFLGWSRGESL